MTYAKLEYIREDREAIRATREDGTMVVLEPSMTELWRIVQQGKLGHVAEYVPPPEPTAEEKLAAERGQMRCHIVQFHLALLRADRLQDAVSAAEQDAEISIMFKQSPFIARWSKSVEHLESNGFEPEEIDDLFREAMTIVV